MAQTVTAAINGSVLPVVKVPAGGTNLALSNFLPASLLQRQAVRVLSSEGNFDMQLLAESAPNTVTNFLRYVDQGLYRDLLVHRSVPGFVIQTGGVSLQDYDLQYVPTFSAITNEFHLSNLRGTVAMAKAPGDPDSATSQWFVNLANNTNLDADNGGFTVFARVLGGGMSNVDRIAALPIYNETGTFSFFGGMFAELPLKNYNTNNGIFISNLVVISNVLKLPGSLSSDPNAFAAEVAGNSLRVRFRGFPSNAVTVAVHSYDSATNPCTVSAPLVAPAQKFYGLLARSNRSFPTIAMLSVAPTGVFSGTLANRSGTARISTAILYQQFQFTNPNTGVLLRTLGESIAYWYGHEDAAFFAIDYSNTNASAGFTNTLKGAVLPQAYSGASNDLFPHAGKIVNAVLTRTNESPRPVLGCLQFAFDKAGVAQISATLPDYRTATGSSAVVVEPWTGDKLLPVALFARLGQAAELTGTLRVSASAGATSPVTGSLDWVVGTNVSSVQVASAVWTSPGRGSNALTGNTNTISCALCIPVLAQTNQTLTWGAGNKPLLNPTNGTTIKVDTTKGSFAGTATKALGNGQSLNIPYRGVLFSTVPPGMDSGLRGAGLANQGSSNNPAPVKIVVP